MPVLPLGRLAPPCELAGSQASPGVERTLADEVVRFIEGLPAKRPLVVGVHGPQGSGKSTLCEGVRAALTARGLRVAAVSVDDFYLTHEDQRALAAAHPGDTTLEHRGYPGTHDLRLADAILDALSGEGPDLVAVPTYDKSAHAGRGDRAPRTLWREVETPLDVLLFEGWMLAFAPAPDDDTPLELAPTNRLLADYTWRARLDALVHLTTADLEQIVRWRVDSERARRATGSPALSDAEAEDYVRRFLPAYRLWTPPLLAAPPLASLLEVDLAPDRSPRRLTHRSR
jgi:D-glycerate 3-kinase